MNLWDFLNQASFWTWVGLLFLTGIAAAGLSGLITITINRKKE